MRRILLGIIGVVCAVVLMIALAAAGMTLSRSNPGIHPAFVFAPLGVLYTVIIMAVMSRF